jgi:PEP-CTERM motif-containing protein
MNSIRKTLRALAITAIPAALAFTATPALATRAPPPPPPTPATDPCSAGFVVGAIACQGYYGGNLITGTTGSATTAAELTYINLLLNGTASTSDTTPTNNTGAYTPPYSIPDSTVLAALTNLNGSSTMNFGITLSGLTILGAHFGNNIESDPNNVTAFWLVDLGNTSTTTLNFVNGQGSSNAQIFGTGGTHLPEPGTWAMMLFGFGAIGVSMRRSRRKNTLATQLA